MAYDKSQASDHSNFKLQNWKTLEEAEAAAMRAQADYRANSRPRDLPPSGYYGVSASNDRWQAWIKYGGKRHYIGSFRTKSPRVQKREGK